MKTQELITASEQALSPALRHMKLKELEKHAQKILRKLGQPDYETMIRTLIKSIPKLDTVNRFEETQKIIKQALPVASNDADIDQDLIARFTVIAMVIISKEFKEIHDQK